MVPNRCLSGNGGMIQAGYSNDRAVCNHTKFWNLRRTGLGLLELKVSTRVYILILLLLLYIANIYNHRLTFVVTR
jgi:hypothetical protein